MRVGDCVITPYNQEGIVVKLFQETRCCIVEVEGEEQGYHCTELTPTCFEFEEDNMHNTIPMFEHGDEVCIKGHSIVCKVLNVVGIEDDMVWYDINMDGDVICEEESNLSYVGKNVITKPKSTIPTVKEYKFAVAYQDGLNWEYFICDINDIRSFLNNQECFHCMKTYVFKTGRAFPGTEAFNSDDIASLNGANKIPPLVTGSTVWIYNRQKWGTVTECGIYDSSGVVLEDGTSILADYDEMFIPVQTAETELRVSK